MRSERSVLIIGHSHIECLRQAVESSDYANVHILDLRKVMGSEPLQLHERVERVLASTPVQKPDAVCLCLGGNQHNILGIIENPEPFSVGHPHAGSAPPADDARHFIPSQLMKDYFHAHSSRALTHALYDAFPNSTRSYLNPPPPVSDWAHIENNPGVFRDKLHMGPPPLALKLRLYQLQSETLRETAQDASALFIEPEEELVDEHGFLGSEYFNQDPTHGNLAYGKVMLQKIIRTAGEAG